MMPDSLTRDAKLRASVVTFEDWNIVGVLLVLGEASIEDRSLICPVGKKKHDFTCWRRLVPSRPNVNSKLTPKTDSLHVAHSSLMLEYSLICYPWLLSLVYDDYDAWFIDPWCEAQILSRYIRGLKSQNRIVQLMNSVASGPMPKQRPGSVRFYWSNRKVYERYDQCEIWSYNRSHHYHWWGEHMSVPWGASIIVASTTRSRNR